MIYIYLLTMVRNLLSRSLNNPNHRSVVLLLAYHFVREGQFQGLLGSAYQNGPLCMFQGASAGDLPVAKYV